MTQTTLLMLLLAALALLALSLVLNWKLANALGERSEDRDFYRERLKGLGDVITGTLEREIKTLDETLLEYGTFADRSAAEAVAVGQLVEDLKMMSTVADYGRSVGWPKVFALLAAARVRVTVARHVLSRSPSTPNEVSVRVDKLLRQLRGFATLTGFYLHYKQARSPGRERRATRDWPYLSVAQTSADEVQEGARQLLRLLADGRQ